jgi:hypothetical protein
MARSAAPDQTGQTPNALSFLAAEWLSGTTGRTLAPSTSPISSYESGPGREVRPAYSYSVVTYPFSTPANP